jgi:hypothetical protein
MENLLDANGYTPLRWVPMDLLTDIKLYWWHSEIVAKMTTVRIFMAIAILKGWSICEMDVNNVFLHGDLQEKLYMTPPPGLFSSSSTEVCHLKRSLYGLKQAPRAWFEKFRTTLLDFTFMQSQYDYSLFFSKTNIGIVQLLVYVDDIVIIGSDS